MERVLRNNAPHGAYSPILQDKRHDSLDFDGEEEVPGPDPAIGRNENVVRVGRLSRIERYSPQNRKSKSGKLMKHLFEINELSSSGYSTPGHYRVYPLKKQRTT